ncbi:MAG: gas vesicle protein GvpG [Gaiellaceae bacterium]
MGLITGLLTLPLAPVRGVSWIAEVLGEEADRQMAEAASPERALAELEAARATGEISEEDAVQLEAQIVDEMIRLRAERGDR